MTSKDYLSQEEIDALLRQSSSDPEPVTTDAAEESITSFLDTIEQDALGEIGNITFGSAATALSTLLGKKVDITTPQVTLVKRSELKEVFPKPHVAVSVEYVDGFQGINSLVIRTHDAQVIADLMLGGEGDVPPGELNEIHISAVQEAMNQMMGSSATSMSTIFNRFVNISPPGINILDVDNGDGVNSLPQDDYFINVSFRLMIGDLIDSTIMQLLPVSFAKQMVQTLMGGMDEAPAPVAAASAPAPVQAVAAPAAASVPAPQPPAAMPPAAPPAAYAQPQQQAYAMPPQGPNTYGQHPNRNVNVQPVQFANFQGAPYVQADDTNLNLLLDIPLKVTVELGRTQKQIKDILELSQGSIIELDKLAGEPVDILVNNKLIAKGEVVVIDENFGVRVTDIVSQWDRMQKIQ
ncbi:flagellar motor switch protein FliN/FliY [Paenibacillus cellulosilyticus]|uniref:Flagellar motor switch protein FliN/FliY n=1 Tax=Paenibacillus cellulosilyticus TaxID=375489 RepID=A0A2V2Z030_9BACL|nr:flagellar motor switch phosphatase FliY [Paenibacillus cellulosilyticus]PWW06405.1 flagellar motor switch protein FliN/FliY [Paenibacillus cellulosilyticus]QKS46249.1 flagellar motor switch phosphatase FliY [Paenibacillus cellulosilyticus]